MIVKLLTNDWQMIDKWLFSAIEIVHPQKVTSLVYKYYTKVQDGHKCNSCGITKKTKCTSNLINHLQSSDRHEILSYMQDNKNI
jgi:hypothetical protein